MSLAQDVAQVLRLPEAWPEHATVIDVTALHRPGADGADLLARAEESAADLATLLAARFAGAEGATAQAAPRADGVVLRIEGTAVPALLLPIAIRAMIDVHHAVPPPEMAALLAAEDVPLPAPIVFRDTVASLSASAAPAPGGGAQSTDGMTGLVAVPGPTSALPEAVRGLAKEGRLDLERVEIPGRAMPDAEVEDAILRGFTSGLFAFPAGDGEEPELWDGEDGLVIAPCRMDAALLAALIPTFPAA